MGMRATVAPSDETRPLLSPEHTTTELAKSVRLQGNITLCAVLITLTVAISVFSGIGLLVWRLNDNMNEMKAAVAPHAEMLVNTTLDLVNDIGGSMNHAHAVAEKTHSVAEAGTPSIITTLNNTALITGALQQFLTHPTISLSLGGLGNNDHTQGRL